MLNCEIFYCPLIMKCFDSMGKYIWLSVWSDSCSCGNIREMTMWLYWMEVGNYCSIGRWAKGQGSEHGRLCLIILILRIFFIQMVDKYQYFIIMELNCLIWWFVRNENFKFRFHFKHFLFTPQMTWKINLSVRAN